jgi:Cd2+/Zn2+-exporting ATPase
MSEVEALEVRVANMDCENDAAVIERGLRHHADIVDVETWPKSAKVRLKYRSGLVTPEQISERLKHLGFPVVVDRGPPSAVPPWRNPKVIASVVSGLLVGGGFVLDAGDASVVLYLLAITVGGYHFGREALEELVLERQIGIELLMLVAAVAALALGEAGEGALLVFLYSISEALEGYTEQKTRSAIRALMDLTPEMARRLVDGREEEIPAEDLQIDDVFTVRPGESIVTDGVVVAGSSSVNQAPVTGESVPVAKSVEDEVFAGTINGSGALQVRATHRFAENTIARIVAMVEEAQERKGQNERFIDRFGRRYSPAVLGVGLLIGLVPTLLGADPTAWAERAVVFIVAAAPCALVISIPITSVASLGTAARRGVLIKGGLHLEELARVDTVALDKTGTLTRGAPEVADIVVVGAHDAKELLAIAAGIERWSEHPLARAVVRRAVRDGVEPAATADFEAVVGSGARATLGGAPVFVGSANFFEEQVGVDVTSIRDDLDRLRTAGHSVIIVGDEHQVLGFLGLRDEVRPNVKAALEALRRAGIKKIVMLTGDNEGTARAIAAEVGIETVHAGLKPDDKVAHVRELAAVGSVAMVGDGVNDAPALAEATVGIAMGAAGTDVALETADVALMADDLEKLAEALRLAQRSRRIVRQNLGLSMVVIGSLVVGALGGFFGLPAAVLAHELSEFAVIGNGLRMLRADPGSTSVLD